MKLEIPATSWSDTMSDACELVRLVVSSECESSITSCCRSKEVAWDEPGDNGR